jgi:hypothetical protein
LWDKGQHVKATEAKKDGKDHRPTACIRRRKRRNRKIRKRKGEEEG